MTRAESLGFHSAWTQEAVLVFSAFEVDPAHLVARFTEGLQLMKACWTEPRITFEGRFWQLDGAFVEPKPFQKPYPPLWIGGNHPEAVRRALRYGNGFFGAGSSTTAQFAQQVDVLRAALLEAHQDPSRWSGQRFGDTLRPLGEVPYTERIERALSNMGEH